MLRRVLGVFSSFTRIKRTFVYYEYTQNVIYPYSMFK